MRHQWEPLERVRVLYQLIEEFERSHYHRNSVTLSGSEVRWLTLTVTETTTVGGLINAIEQEGREELYPFRRWLERDTNKGAQQ